MITKTTVVLFVMYAWLQLLSFVAAANINDGLAQKSIFVWAMNLIMYPFWQLLSVLVLLFIIRELFSDFK